MKYKRNFCMSKFITIEDMLEAKVKYLEAEVDNALQRLHMAKRRAREDKVKLRNVIASYRESHEELRQVIEDQREYTEFMETLNDPWNE